MRIAVLYKRTTLVIGSIIVCAIVFTQCINNKQQEKVSIKNAKGQQYAGSATCRSCHKAISDSFATSAHFLSSGIASAEYIKGSFEENENTFIYDSSRKVVMEKREDGLYQVAYVNGKEERAQRFDIVIGSGKRGQSYLYWRHKGLNQLPVSYFARLNTWVNSPGFTTRSIFFDRVIEARCLECHTTYAKEGYTEEYDPNQLILGIDCEKCHGPAKEHVDFHTKNQSETKGKFIINTGVLTRQQQLDNCALCHSGTMQGRSSAFSFRPGDTLSKHFVRNFARIDSFNLDVHANQYGLLTASKCFRVSQTMQCGTCHDPHVKESGNLMAYTQKCIGCHRQDGHNFCTLKAEPGTLLSENCVNCHMPVKESKNITILTSGKAVPSSQPVRTHLIAVYLEEIK